MNHLQHCQRECGTARSRVAAFRRELAEALRREAAARETLQTAEGDDCARRRAGLKPFVAGAFGSPLADARA